jgi:hypothetical protein
VLAAGGIEHRAHRGGGLLADDEGNRRFGMQPLAMLAAASIRHRWGVRRHSRRRQQSGFAGQAATGSGTLTWLVIGWHGLVGDLGELAGRRALGGRFQR